MDEAETASLNSDGKSNANKYQLIDYLVKRLEHTINHTQTATKLIYFVNGAILAAIYFEFGKVQPISSAFLVASIFCFLLCIVNFLHANFMAIQNAWYSTIDQQIRKIFISFEGVEEVWSKHLGELLDEVLNGYGTNYRIFPFKRSHKIYVWLHLVITVFLLIFSLAFFLMWLKPPDVTIFIK